MYEENHMFDNISKVKTYMFAIIIDDMNVFFPTKHDDIQNLKKLYEFKIHLD